MGVEDLSMAQGSETRMPASQDITPVLVEELEGLLNISSFTHRCYDEGRVYWPSHKPQTALRVIDALKENASADWRAVTELLARLYCSPFDCLGNGLSSCRAQALNTFAGDYTWPDIFRACLSRFEGSLDLKLILPMVKLAPWIGGSRNIELGNRGSGTTFWFEPDVEVYKLLASRGGVFLCKIWWETNSAWEKEYTKSATPGDAFIWLAPDVSEFLFAQNGWKKKNLKVTFERLERQLVTSGNRVAYRWFIENASRYDDFKQPTLKEVVESPLLRPYLESKKDASVRSKDVVSFIMQTIKGEYCDDTALFIAKAALDNEAIKALKSYLSAIKDEEMQPVVREAMLALEGHSVKSETKGPRAKKMTVPQTVTVVADALDEGDSSKLSMLEPIAEKVPMADCVELLERAAANCDGAAIGKLYELFSPFECASSALLVALFSGNASTSRALVARGVDLEGDLVMIDKKRTPRQKKRARENRYSHGLMNRAYTSGGMIACSLKEALTKYNGEIESRTKVTKWGEKLVVNTPSRDKAAKTLVAISGEEGFSETIAVKLLWNLISFDGRKTADARFDAAAARIILKAGILPEEYVADLPWREAYGSLVGNCLPEYYYEAIKLIKDFASAEVFPTCWRARFAKPGERIGRSGEYEHIKTLLLFIDVLDADNCSDQLDILRALIHEGKLKHLKKLAAKPGWFTKQRIKQLIGEASAAGNTEITAWLLELSASSSGE